MAKCKMKVNYLSENKGLLSAYILLSAESEKAWKQAIGNNILPAELNIKDVMIKDSHDGLGDGYGRKYPTPHYKDQTITETTDTFFWTSNKKIAKPLEEDVRKILTPLLWKMQDIHNATYSNESRLCSPGDSGLNKFFCHLNGRPRGNKRYLDPAIYNNIPFDCVEISITRDGDKINGQSCNYLHYDKNGIR